MQDLIGQNSTESGGMASVAWFEESGGQRLAQPESKGAGRSAAISWGDRNKEEPFDECRLVESGQLVVSCLNWGKNGKNRIKS